MKLFPSYAEALEHAAEQPAETLYQSPWDMLSASVDVLMSRQQAESA
jgi:hypothetical protein